MASGRRSLARDDTAEVTRAEFNKLVTAVNSLIAAFNKHNHAYDDGAVTEYTSKPNDGDTNAPTIAATTAIPAVTSAAEQVEDVTETSSLTSNK